MLFIFFELSPKFKYCCKRNNKNGLALNSVVGKFFFDLICFSWSYSEAPSMVYAVLNCLVLHCRINIIHERPMDMPSKPVLLNEQKFKVTECCFQ